MNTPQIAAAIARRAAIMQALSESPEGLRMPQLIAVSGLTRRPTIDALRRSGAVLVGKSHTAVWAHPDHAVTAQASHAARAVETFNVLRERHSKKNRIARGYVEVRKPKVMSDYPVVRILTEWKKPPYTRAPRSIFEAAA
jgi:hypothetical protein